MLHHIWAISFFILLMMGLTTLIGNDTCLSITHTDSKTSSPSNSFKLNHVLCVPFIQKNFISVSKFCHQNNTSIEFSPSSFFVKDLTMGTTLLQHQAKVGVHKWWFSHHNRL